MLLIVVCARTVRERTSLCTVLAPRPYPEAGDLTAEVTDPSRGIMIACIGNIITIAVCFFFKSLCEGHAINHDKL